MGYVKLIIYLCPSPYSHQELSLLSRYCHQKAAVGIDVSDLEEQIDELAAGMWGLMPEELQDVKVSLEELR